MKTKTLKILNETFKHGFGSMPFVILKNPKISSNLKVLYLLLLSYAWYEAECFPGQDRLARELGWSDRNVRKNLIKLKELGLIDWKRRGAEKTNIYYILKIPENLLQAYDDMNEPSYCSLTPNCFTKEDYFIDNLNKVIYYKERY